MALTHSDDLASQVLDRYLHSVSGLADHVDEIARKLQERGFRAFVPQFDAAWGISNRDRDIRREWLKEQSGCRHVLVAGVPRAVGYRSRLLTEVCASVGIDREPDGIPIPQEMYLGKILDSSEREFSRSGQERQDQFYVTKSQSQMLLDEEALLEESNEELQRLPKTQWLAEILLSALGQFSYVARKCPNSWSEVVVAPLANSGIEVQLIVPRSGPRIGDWLPTAGVQVARPWPTEDQRIRMRDPWSTSWFDNRFALYMSALVPGMTVYATGQTWAQVIRGMSATAALYQIIEPKLREASEVLADW